MSIRVSAMGKAFDEAKNDDSFHLPPEVFENPDFQRGMKSFFSPDGKTVRMIISHRGNPSTPEGLTLLFDTLVVRSFMTPAFATLLGRWFWWPMNVRTRPQPVRQRESVEVGAG